MHDIFLKCHARILFEKSGEIFFGKIESFCYLILRDLFCIMYLYVLHNSS